VTARFRVPKRRPFHRLAKPFDTIDTNKDGFITTDEMKVARAKAVAVMFKRLDADNDGRISKTEADAKALWLAKHFTMMDANNDGYISQDELAVARKKWRGGTRCRVSFSYVHAKQFFIESRLEVSNDHA
jgi:hypothetical protein